MVNSAVFIVCEIALPLEIPFLSKIRPPPDVPGCGGVEYAVKNFTGEVQPFLPCGIMKSNTASCSVPLLVTDASVPGSPVVTVPTRTVAAVP